MKSTCHIFVVLCVILSIGHSSIAQQRCGTMERLYYEMEIDGSINFKRQSIEKKINRWKKQSNASTSFTIPVVFHILYKNDSEFINSQQILSQLDVLNEDFNRNNSDANQTPNDFLNAAANCDIHFCLAQRTVDNDTSNGITYTPTDVSSFSLYDNRIFHDSLGGKTIWDSDKFLNIYVCDLSNALGFASFPGSNESRDAVVIDFEHFGTIDVSPPCNKGRTATHEVGHWLNLLHVWGDGNCGSDQVSDTPVQETENYGCPSHPSPSCDNDGDMFQNFMDYTDDACMNLFTNGQKERMHATLNVERSTISNPMYCQLPFEDIGIYENITPLENQEYCGQDLEISTSLYNYSESVINSATIYFQIDDQSMQSVDWNGSLEPNSSISIDLASVSLNPGFHSLTIYSSSPNGFRDLNPNNDTLQLEFLVKSGTNFDITIQTDNYAEENYWEIQNSIGQVITSGSNLISNDINSFNFCQDIDSCYTLILYDEYDDGICCDFGNGFLQVNQQIYSGSFNSEIEIDLCSVSSSAVFDNPLQAHIFPNPTNGKMTVESLHQPMTSIIIVDVYGKIVFQKSCHTKKEDLNLYHVSSGVYFLQIYTETNSQNFKFFKQ